MVLWVELLTKQFNASQEACEWFLQHMSQEPWWPVQVLIQCPNQMVRQMFQRLVIHVIQRLRPLHYMLYLQNESEEEGSEAIGEMSCVTKFIKSLILLLENGAKAHLRHLTEFFGLLYEFSRMGDEETNFLLQTNVIKSVADFYLGHKNQDCVRTKISYKKQILLTFSFSRLTQRLTMMKIHQTKHCRLKKHDRFRWIR